MAVTNIYLLNICQNKTDIIEKNKKEVLNIMMVLGCSKCPWLNDFLSSQRVSSSLHFPMCDDTHCML